MNGEVALALAKSYVTRCLEGSGALAGKDGVGVASVEQTTTSTADNGVNEITVTLTDGSKHTFTVMNGSRGIKGDKGEPFAVDKTYASVAEMEADFSNSNVQEGAFVVIASNAEDEDNAKLYVKGAAGYTFITDMSGIAGIKGEDGADGSSIERIERTSGSGTPGSMDTYTIQMTDGYTATFTVYNGKDGADGKDGTAGRNGADGKDGTNGKDGVDGITPHIGDNGNWFFGDEDSGVSAGGLTTGTFVGTIAFTVTLPAANWVNDTQTVTSDYFLASNYAYLVVPTPSSYIKYMTSEVYAIDVMKDGEMTFHCAADPQSDLVVDVLRMDVIV